MTQSVASQSEVALVTSAAHQHLLMSAGCMTIAVCQQLPSDSLTLCVDGDQTLRRHSVQQSLIDHIVGMCYLET